MREKKCAVSPKIKLTQEKQHDAGDNITNPSMKLFSCSRMFNQNDYDSLSILNTLYT